MYENCAGEVSLGVFVRINFEFLTRLTRAFDGSVPPEPDVVVTSKVYGGFVAPLNLPLLTASG